MPINVSMQTCHKMEYCQLHDEERHAKDVNILILYDFLVTVKAAPHECVIRTGQP